MRYSTRVRIRPMATTDHEPDCVAAWGECSTIRPSRLLTPILTGLARNAASTSGEAGIRKPCEVFKMPD